MQKTRSSITKWALLIAVVVMTLPVTAFAQRRFVVVRPRRNRVVIYQPRPTVIYRQSYSPYYGNQPYYSTQYYNNGYQTYGTYGYQPYGTTYTYRYSQPSYVNRYAYAPDYGYGYRQYRPRHRSRVRFGISIR